MLTGGAERRARFVEHLLIEAGMWAEDREGFPEIDTIYFGGGTPSALGPEELARILGALRENLSVHPDAWTFFEANPEDITQESAQAWRDLGVRTLSLGIQSFDPDALRFLGRRHGPKEALRSFETVRAAGFDTVSIDLIFGLPGQTPEQWLQTLETAISLGPDHISCYQLTFHEGTPFGFRLARGKLAEMPEPEQAELFLLTHRVLADHGLPGYEVSNFARGPEHQSRHNKKYWDHTPYLGLGPSAHSFSGTQRWWNERKLKPYEARIERGARPIVGSEDLTPRDLALESLMLGFRTAAGIDSDVFRARYGIDLLEGNATLIDRLKQEGLLRIESGRLIPTLEGLAVADSLARDFEL